jgi:uncharacterized protein involved in exopolysaccharide biosynthesis
MQEVDDRILAIKALNELEILEAEKTRLAEEVGGFRVARGDLEILQGKVDSLNKEVEGAKAGYQTRLKGH